MKTIYYVRHGESQANVDGLTAGAEMDSPLTKKGIEQAKKAGRELKGRKIELVVCSPLERTRDTAKLIADQIGYDDNRIIERPEFIERSVGIYSERPYAEYVDHVRGSKQHPSIETSEAIHKRVKKGLNWLRGQKADTVLVVSHGGTSRMLRAILDDIHHSDFYKVEPLDNGHIFKFTLE